MTSDIRFKMESVFPAKLPNEIDKPIGSFSDKKLYGTSNDKIERKDEDYLSKATYLDSKVLRSESILSWEEVLSDQRTDATFEQIIKEFLIPYDISLLKYSFNKAYYQSTDQINVNPNLHIAPSLKVIKKDSKFKVRGYPAWLYIGFPDVVKWAVLEGWKKVKAELERYPESLLFNGFGHLHSKFIKEIIEIYMREFPALECQVQRAEKHSAKDPITDEKKVAQESMNQILIDKFRQLAKANKCAPTGKTSDKKILQIYPKVGSAFMKISQERGEIIPGKNLNAIVFKFIQVYEMGGDQYLSDHLEYEIEKYKEVGLREEYRNQEIILSSTK